jgi:hypothetical protein
MTHAMLQTKIDGSLRLLEECRHYFETHPHAAAFRWRRVGVMRNQLHDWKGARAALYRSFVVEPSALTLWHLLRAVRRTPSRYHDSSPNSRIRAVL